MADLRKDLPPSLGALIVQLSALEAPDAAIEAIAVAYWMGRAEAGAADAAAALLASKSALQRVEALRRDRSVS